jgi:Flp pilus assembly protein TadG
MNRPRRNRAPRHGEGGQATVELALVLPVLLGLVFVALQMAVIARQQILAIHAAREAARVASVDPDRGHAVAAAKRVLPGAQVVLAARPAAGEPQAVDVIDRVPVHLPLLAPFVREVRVSAHAAMRVER